ncbi:M50 family metallopeptidase [Bacillus tianshenii]|nr:M50 family metallopeptidase [Bacillus tianshenii]
MSKFVSLMKKCTIHPLFWIVAAIGVLSGRFMETAMVFAIIFIHEMGHAATAHFFNWKIKKIELFPFGGVAEVDEHGNRPLKEEMLVILAGPAQHVWMIGLSYLLFLTGLIGETFHNIFVLHNVMILSFNLLPIWPLDGGRILLTLFSSRVPFLQAYRYALLVSFTAFGIVLLLHLIFSYYHLNLWIILGFLLLSQVLEWKQQKFTHVRFLLERYYGRQTEISQLKSILVEETTYLHEVFSGFCRGYKHQIIMQLKGGGQLTLDENEVLHAFFAEKQTNCTVGELFG